MIISASRRTDIPAFYTEWFMNRMKDGYVIVRNPMNYNQLSRVCLTADLVDCIVFWTKDPRPMIPRLTELSDYTFYFQFTLTAYGRDVEKNLPDKKSVLIPAFRELSRLIGPERVIWRYDPILITSRYSEAYHLKAFREIAEALSGYTEKCVFSFVDSYARNQKALKALGIQAQTNDAMRRMAKKMRDIAAENHMRIATCAERINLEDLGIDHNACVDKQLIERLTGGTIKNTKKNSKDQGQRGDCRCMPSKEIGAHNTCGHGCVYCYANFSPESVKKSMALYDPNSPILCDKIGENDVIKDAGDMKKLVITDGQMSLFQMKT